MHTLIQPAAGASTLRIDSPLGYGPIEPVRRDTWVRLLPAGQVPSMAAMLQAVPLAADEFADAAAHYPIVLLREGGDDRKPALIPAALLGLRPGRNPFSVRNVRVTRWVDGVYVPAYLRRWPLCTAAPASSAPENHAARLTLCIESVRQTTGAVSGSVRLFSADGTPTDHARALIGWVKDYDAGLVRAREMAALWQRLGLVKTASWSHPSTPHLHAIQLQGLWVVDPAALAALGRAAVFDLHERRMIAATHLAAESLTRFAALYERTVAAAKDWQLPASARSLAHAAS